MSVKRLVSTFVARECTDKSKLIFDFQIYLGKKRIHKHWNAFPSHRTEPDTDTCETNGFTNSKSTIFNELISRLEKTDEEHRTEYLLSELSSFMSEVSKLQEHILSASTAPGQREYNVDENVSKMLGITTGKYALNDKFLENYKSSITKSSTECFNGTSTDMSQVELDHITDNAVESASMETFFKNTTTIENSTPINISLDFISYNNT